MNTVEMTMTYNKAKNTHYYFCKFGNNRKRRISKARFMYIEIFAKRADTMTTFIKGEKVINTKTIYLHFIDYHFLMTA